MNKTYKISMYYDDYLVNHHNIIAHDIITKDNSVIFYTVKETIDYLNINDIQYVIETSLKQKVKDIIIFKKFIFFSLLILLFCIYINGYRVQNIIFNIDTPINDKIEEQISLSYKKLLFFNFTTVDLQKLSKDLRSEYSCYEWISISKNFDIIEVEIIKTGLNNQYEDELYGDIISTKEAIVESYKVFSGSVLIEKNQYIKPGDILIKGMYNDVIVSPKGVVLGYTFEIKTYKINKEITENKLTGSNTSFFKVDFLNKSIDITKEFKYNIYEETFKEYFKIPYVLTLYKVEHQEKENLTYFNDEESACEYGYTLIEQEFNDNKIISDEKIDTMKFLSSNEFDDYYEITYLVKKLESIGKFEENI